MNLLQETLDVLNKHSLDPTVDVSWVGALDGSLVCSWNDFVTMAKDLEYDNGFGGQEILPSLVIVGKAGWWLERGEYDGSEWWEFNKTPMIGADPKRLQDLRDKGY